MRRVLFVDPDHGARSQLAEALLRNAVAIVHGGAPTGTRSRPRGIESGGTVDGVAEVLREVGMGGFVPRAEDVGLRVAMLAILPPI